MKTFKQIVEKFQAAANYHTYIQSFGFGSLDNLNNMINQGYPLMWLRPLQSTGVQPYGQRTLSFEVYILTVPKQTDSDLVQQYSDTERTCYDVYTYFRDGQDQQSYEVNLTLMVPVAEAFQDRLCGWVMNIDVITDSSGLTFCKIPH